jgi:hypothetical protein
MSVDYDKWRKMELWELWQCVYLLLNREPNLSEFLDRQDFYYGSEFWNKFDEISKMAEASIKRGTLKTYSHYPNIVYVELIPGEFLSWAKSKGFEIPEPLIDLLNARHTKLMQIAEEVTTLFWLNRGDKPAPKSTEIKDYLKKKYGLSNNEARSIDKICRPESSKKGGTKPLKK